MPYLTLALFYVTASPVIGVRLQVIAQAPELIAQAQNIRVEANT